MHLHRKRDSLTSILDLNHGSPVAPSKTLQQSLPVRNLPLQMTVVPTTHSPISQSLPVFPNGNLLSLKASKLAAELQHPPSSLTERRGVGGQGRRGVCPLRQRIEPPPNHKRESPLASLLPPRFDTLEL
jgi:hypothetical protein